MKKRIGWAIPTALAIGLLCGCGASKKTVPEENAPEASAADAPGLAKAPAKTPVASENPAGKFKLNGFGKKDGKSIAIINRELVAVGTELDENVVVKEITDTYVELSIEGSRYRLYSASLRPKGDPMLTEPVKVENRD